MPQRSIFPPPPAPIFCHFSIFLKITLNIFLPYICICVYIYITYVKCSFLHKTNGWFLFLSWEIVFLIVLENFLTLLEYYFSALYFGQFGKLYLFSLEGVSLWASVIYSVSSVQEGIKLLWMKGNNKTHSFQKLFLFMCMFVCMCAVVRVWRSEDIFRELVFSFYRVELNSGHQVWWQALLPTEPSPQSF